LRAFDRRYLKPFFTTLRSGFCSVLFVCPHHRIHVFAVSSNAFLLIVIAMANKTLTNKNKRRPRTRVDEEPDIMDLAEKEFLNFEGEEAELSSQSKERGAVAVLGLCCMHAVLCLCRLVVVIRSGE
jgi:hypothetical protein